MNFLETEMEYKKYILSNITATQKFGLVKTSSQINSKDKALEEIHSLASVIQSLASEYQLDIHITRDSCTVAPKSK